MFILIRCCLLTSLSHWLVTGAASTEDDNQATRRGHCNPRFSQLISKEKYTRTGQEYVTDQLPDQTESTMSPSRRGDKDSASSRTKRFAHMGIRWSKTGLTYNISNYPRNLEEPVTDKAIRKAFSVWSRVTPLTFTQKSDGPVDIDIRFESGDHGDSQPFNSTILAHSSGPCVFGGFVHFNKDVEWTINSSFSVNLFKVAAHEFGHALGLDHSEVDSALMFAEYKGYEQSFELDSDDIDGIQGLYGRKRTESQASEGQGLCKDTKIDTIFFTADGDTYVFKGHQYWKLTCADVAYPRPISKRWVGLPGNIDAAFTFTDNKTYFFKGSQFWRYTGNHMDEDYPKKISEGFPGIPDNIDTAMVNHYGRVVFFKGSESWFMDSIGQPSPNIYAVISFLWSGIPDNLDAAIWYGDDDTYFFKGGDYYKYDRVNPPIPQPAGPRWFGCGPYVPDARALVRIEKDRVNPPIPQHAGPRWFGCGPYVPAPRALVGIKQTLMDLMHGGWSREYYW